LRAEEEPDNWAPDGDDAGRLRAEEEPDNWAPDGDDAGRLRAEMRVSLRYTRHIGPWPVRLAFGPPSGDNSATNSAVLELRWWHRSCGEGATVAREPALRAGSMVRRAKSAAGRSLSLGGKRNYCHPEARLMWQLWLM
jgi:hypothetical protein